MTFGENDPPRIAILRPSCLSLRVSLCHSLCQKTLELASSHIEMKRLVWERHQASQTERPRTEARTRRKEQSFTAIMCTPIEMTEGPQHRNSSISATVQTFVGSSEIALQTVS